MHNENNDYQSCFDADKVTDIAFGTSANYAYDLYKEKMERIAALEYECKLLVDKYHSEMCHSHIPVQFRQELIEDIFSKDKKKVKFAREQFLRKGFSDNFLQKHSIAFKEVRWQGYERIGAAIIFDIDGGDYYYSFEIPFPENIKKDEIRKRLVGGVKFRADRIAKSKWDNFVKEWQSVKMPTYDWKECFKAIEADVAKEEGT